MLKPITKEPAEINILIEKVSKLEVEAKQKDAELKKKSRRKSLGFYRSRFG